MAYHSEEASCAASKNYYFLKYFSRVLFFRGREQMESLKEIFLINALTLEKYMPPMRTVHRAVNYKFECMCRLFNARQLDGTHLFISRWCLFAGEVTRGRVFRH